MLFLGLVSTLLLSWQTQVSPENPRQELKRRLAAYAARDQKDPAALRPIAQLALEAVATAPTFEVWIEACSSPYVPERSGCRDALWRTLKQQDAPLLQRVRSGAALIRRGDKSAVSLVAQLVPKLTNRELASVASAVALLPASTAAPVLLRLLGSQEVADKTAACRALGAVDIAEVRAALQSVVAQSPPSLQPWNACQVARARLKEPDSMATISGYSRYMEGEDLLHAANVMLDIGNEQGVFLLRRLTRDAPSIVQLRAAERLAATDPDAAARIVDAKINDPDPRVRAHALVVERELKRPSDAALSKLLDKDELVQVRAAEAVLARTSHAQ